MHELPQHLTSRRGPVTYYLARALNDAGFLNQQQVDLIAEEVLGPAIHRRRHFVGEGAQIQFYADRIYEAVVRVHLQHVGDDFPGLLAELCRRLRSTPISESGGDVRMVEPTRDAIARDLVFSRPPKTPMTNSNAAERPKLPTIATWRIVNADGWGYLDERTARAHSFGDTMWRCRVEYAHEMFGAPIGAMRCVLPGGVVIEYERGAPWVATASVDLGAIEPRTAPVLGLLLRQLDAELSPAAGTDEPRAQALVEEVRALLKDARESEFDFALEAQSV